jgi:hypothetical protein
VTTAQAFDLTHVFNKTIASRVGHHESWFLSFGISGRFCRCDGAFFAPIPTLCVAGQHPVLLASVRYSACPEWADAVGMGPFGTILSSLSVFL